MTVYELMKFVSGDVTVADRLWGIKCPDGHKESCDGCEYAADNTNCLNIPDFIYDKRYEGPAKKTPISLADREVAHILHGKTSIWVIMKGNL